MKTLLDCIVSLRCKTITDVYLVNKRVQLCNFLWALIQLLLGFVDILLYSLPVHLDIATVVSYLQGENQRKTLSKRV